MDPTSDSNRGRFAALRFPHFSLKTKVLSAGIFFFIALLAAFLINLKVQIASAKDGSYQQGYQYGLKIWSQPDAFPSEVPLPK